MILKLILAILIITPGFLIAFATSIGRHKYWFAGNFYLMVVVLIGLNSLILSLFRMQLTEKNLIIIFGIESLIGCGTLYYSILRRGKPDLSTANERVIPPGGTLKAAVVLLITAAFLMMIPFALTKKKNSGYTEFYFQESDVNGLAWMQTYPLNASIPLNLGVNNQEVNPTRYLIYLYANQNVVGYVDLGVVAPGQDVTQQVVLPASPETNTRYEFLLYKNVEDTPYRILYLWIRRGND